MNKNDNSPQKIVILGGNGQLGKAFQAILKTDAPSSQIFTAFRKDADLSNLPSCLNYLESIQPNLVINAAAFTQVDLAESDTQTAYQVNAESPGEIAQWCSKRQIPFLHFSTDYVFSGEGTQPWKESDPIQPMNHYGFTKAEGEKKIISAGGRYLIFRTSWVYDSSGKNFLNTMLTLGKSKEQLRVVDDQVGAPTFASDLAQGAYQAFQAALLEPTFPSGIYHLTNSGETSWYGFASAIFEIAHGMKIPLKIKTLEPILTTDFPTPARRPKNSRLSNEKVINTFKVRLPHWKDSLTQCMKDLS